MSVLFTDVARFTPLAERLDPEDVHRIMNRRFDVRGEVAVRAGQAGVASIALGQALEIARAIGYPTLTWKAAHLLAQARAAGGQGAEALAAAELAAATIERIATAAPEADLRRTFLAWHPVAKALEDAERLRRL